MDVSGIRERAWSLSPTKASGLRPDWLKDARPVYVAAGLALLLSCFRVWQLSQISLWQDDFIFLDRAANSPLTSDFVLQTYGGQLRPGTFVFADVVSHFPNHRWLVAALIILALEVLRLGAAYGASRALMGTRWATLIPFTLLAFTPLWTPATLWWAAALQSLPLQICLLGSVWFASDYLRKATFRTLLSLLAVFAAGLFFSEQVLVVPVCVILLLLLREGVANKTGVFAAARVVFVGLPWAILGWLAIGAAYLALYAARTNVSTERPKGGLSRDAGAEAIQGISTVAIGLIGGPWRAMADSDVLTPSLTYGAVFAAGLVTAVLVQTAFLVAGPRAALFGVAVVAAIFALDLFVGPRIGLLGPPHLADPRHYTEAAIATCLVIGIVLTTRYRGAHGHNPRSARTDRHHLVVLGMGVLLTSSLITQVALTAAAAGRDEAGWTREARQQLLRAGAVAVYDGPVPPSLVNHLDTDASASVVLANSAGQIRWNASTTDLRVLDEFGVLRPAALSAVAADAGEGPNRDCGWNIPLDDPVHIPLPRTPLRNTPVAIDYFTDQPAEVLVSAGGLPQDLVLPAGLNRLWLFDNADSTVGISVRSRQGGVLCVTAVTIGTVRPK